MKEKKSIKQCITYVYKKHDTDSSHIIVTTCICYLQQHLQYYVEMLPQARKLVANISYHHEAYHHNYTYTDTT